ncbi:mitochondrial import inner membrane translocase subunit TIM17-3-like [Phragmites australis]|uniref:mitochondrial import inner membrane translocase subunit TIM17-3-like n=1 Tax=Phragmites australis TaxID=29695 RepID=UPI002D78C095|nr:mitochondrial import inner membrane translocase subunit TIM17-3-like [Phragmites australis]
MYGKIDRFIDFVGDGFLLGAAGGSTFHFIRGLRSSPNGGRLAGGAQAVRANGPRVAGLLGAYSAVFCSFETAISLARRREDPWNSIAAGAASTGLLNMRRGASAAALSALLGTTVVVVALGLDWTVSEWHSRLISHRETRKYLVAIAQAHQHSTTPGVSACGSIEYK